MSRYSLNEPGRPAVIRGALTDVRILLYEGPAIKRMVTLDPNDFPYQTNNLKQWFRVAAKSFGKDMKEFLSVGLEKLCLEVNGGVGAKKGSGSLHNEFELHLLDEQGYIKSRLQFITYAESHQRKSQLKKARGEPMNKRRDWSQCTYYYPKENVVYVYLEEHKIQQTWDAEEYFAQYPHHRDQIETRIY